MSLKNGFKRARVGYNYFLNKHTLVLQSVQISTLLGLGDCAAQNIFESREKPYDYGRTFRFACIGIGLGPVLMMWFKFLERTVGQENTLKASFKKVLMDQVIFAPIGLFAIMGIKNCLEGGSLEDFKTQLRDHYSGIMINNYKVWPLIQLINFTFVPLHFRVLFVQSIALGWNTYIAWRLHSTDTNK